MATIPVIRTRSARTDDVIYRLGQQGEIEHDLTTKTLVVHDGLNRGGNSLLRSDFGNVNPVIGRKALEITPFNIGAEVWRGYREITENDAIAETENNFLIAADTQGGNISVTLPSAERVGDRFHVRLMRRGNTAGMLTINAEQDIGDAGKSVALDNVGDAVDLQSTGIVWIIIWNGNSDAGVSTFVELTDTPDMLGGQRQILRMNADGSAMVWENMPDGIGGGGGSSTFAGLDDTPNTASGDLGEANQILRMDSDGRLMQWVDLPPYPTVPVVANQALRDDTSRWDSTKLPAYTMFMHGNDDPVTFPGGNDVFIFANANSMTASRKHITFDNLRIASHGALAWVSGHGYSRGDFVDSAGDVFWCHTPIDPSIIRPENDYNETNWKLLDGRRIRTLYQTPSFNTFAIEGIRVGEIAQGTALGGFKDVSARITNPASIRGDIEFQRWNPSTRNWDVLHTFTRPQDGFGAMISATDVDFETQPVAAYSATYQWRLSATSTRNLPVTLLFSSYVDRRPANAQERIYWGKTATLPVFNTDSDNALAANTTPVIVFSDTGVMNLDVRDGITSENMSADNVPTNHYFYIATPSNKPVTSARNVDSQLSEDEPHFQHLNPDASNNTDFIWGTVNYKIWYIKNMASISQDYNYQVTAG